MDNTSLHSLLLLSDSALPLGSFAFSSGLESYLAHHKLSKPGVPPLQNFHAFLSLSLRNLASTALPYVLAGHRNPAHLPSLDNDLDASTPCTVARRASIAQGKALLTLWERALAPELHQSFSQARETNTTSEEASSQTTRAHLNTFIADFKANKKDVHGLPDLNAHFAPLFGAVCRALGLSAPDTAYLFLLNHAKAVLSAAVRASVMGPYQSHALLASANLQAAIRGFVDKERDTEVWEAGLAVPPMDLWVGRHELLYSRIFNS